METNLDKLKNIVKKSDRKFFKDLAKSIEHDNNLSYLCKKHPNDSELGCVVRFYFQKND